MFKALAFILSNIMAEWCLAISRHGWCILVIIVIRRKRKQEDQGFTARLHMGPYIKNKEHLVLGGQKKVDF